jgi:hypothetical protein
MIDEEEPAKLTAAATRPRSQSAARWSEEGIAALLLRLLGVYFTAWAFISAVDKIVYLIVTSNKHDLDYAVSRYWNYFAYPAAELIVGIYFLIGGQWVYDKVMVPIHRGSPDDGCQPSEEGGTAGSPEVAATHPANTGQPQSPPTADPPPADGPA